MPTKFKTKAAITAAVAISALGAGAGIAGAAGGQDTETPISGDSIDQVVAAALAHTGGGRVTDTELGDEEGFYEVEVTLDDGRQVDVHLDRAFHVIGVEGEASESSDD